MIIVIYLFGFLICPFYCYKVHHVTFFFFWVFYCADMPAANVQHFWKYKNMIEAICVPACRTKTFFSTEGTKKKKPFSIKTDLFLSVGTCN